MRLDLGRLAQVGLQLQEGAVLLALDLLPREAARLRREASAAASAARARAEVADLPVLAERLLDGGRYDG